MSDVASITVLAFSLATLAGISVATIATVREFRRAETHARLMNRSAARIERANEVLERRLAQRPAETPTPRSGSDARTPRPSGTRPMPPAAPSPTREGSDR